MAERTDCDKRPAPRALHYEPRGPVIRAPVQFQPGSMPAFLIARTASGEVRNFRSAVAPAGFLAWLGRDNQDGTVASIRMGLAGAGRTERGRSPSDGRPAPAAPFS